MDDYSAKVNKAVFVSQTEDGILDSLNKQIGYASSNCAFYEPLRAYLPLTSLKELSTLPFVRAEDIVLHGRDMLCVPASRIHRIVSLFTSGTTRAPKRLYFTEGDLSRTVDFFCEGMGWICDPGDKVGILLPCTAPDGVGDLLARGLEKLGCESLRIGPVDSAGDICEQLLAARPRVFVGMPWQLRLLAIAVPELKPERVLLSADYVPESIYPFLEKTWGCRVLGHFGMTETLYGGAVESLLHRGMYLRRDELYAEVIDPLSGETLPPGQIGELVLSTLRREAMPLIRCRTGDLARLSPEREGVIERVLGRAHLHPGNYALQEALCPLAGLYDYSLSSDEDGSILFSALVEEASGSELEDRLLSLAAEAFLTEKKNIHLRLLPCPLNEAKMLNKGKRTGI